MNSAGPCVLSILMTTCWIGWADDDTSIRVRVTSEGRPVCFCQIVSQETDQFLGITSSAGEVQIRAEFSGGKPLSVHVVLRSQRFESTLLAGRTRQTINLPKLRPLRFAEELATASAASERTLKNLLQEHLNSKGAEAVASLDAEALKSLEVLEQSRQTIRTRGSRYWDSLDNFSRLAPLQPPAVSVANESSSRSYVDQLRQRVDYGKLGNQIEERLRSGDFEIIDKYLFDEFDRLGVIVSPNDPTRSLLKRQLAGYRATANDRQAFESQFPVSSFRELELRLSTLEQAAEAIAASDDFWGALDALRLSQGLPELVRSEITRIRNASLTADVDGLDVSETERLAAVNVDHRLTSLRNRLADVQRKPPR